ncbi:MAG: CAP domain-containing protein [Actinomycetota bacterium]|nr:CAP domain-containing protein [Actinomycetota bacterium]
MTPTPDEPVSPASGDTTVTTVASPPTGGTDRAAEATFVTLINDHRAGIGASPLAVDPGLTAAAQAWAAQMASENHLYHQDLEPLLNPWRLVGENVGYGPDEPSLHQGFLNSSGHRANLENNSYTHIGVGVVVDDNGRMWTSHVFGG